MQNDYQNVPVGAWFFQESRDCEHAYSVMERTESGCTLVCSTPYIHDSAKHQMQLIAFLYNWRNHLAVPDPKPADLPAPTPTPTISNFRLGSAFCLFVGGFLTGVLAIHDHSPAEAWASVISMFIAWDQISRGRSNRAS